VAVKSYNFITPNQCHDMHGQSGLPQQQNTIKAGDDWLKANMPALIRSPTRTRASISSPGTKARERTRCRSSPSAQASRSGNAGAVSYNHGSVVKSVEKILNLSVLSKVSGNNELTDLFKAGSYP
jgi:hypothetical protein